MSTPSFFQMLSTEHRLLFAGCRWAKKLPPHFEDSTHDLWVCQFESEKRFLKLCSTSRCASSDFWQVVHHLFGFEFALSLSEYDEVYQKVALWSPLRIPKLFHSVSCCNLVKKGGGIFSGFLLTEYLEGQDVTSNQLTLKQVKQVAEHVALLHQCTQGCFGALFESVENFPPLLNQEMASRDVTAWKTRLKQTLVACNSHHKIPHEVMAHAVQSVNDLNVGRFHPIMLDLRWDQFLQIGGGENLALLDLDAMVWAPKELELVMLEYLLSPEQAEAFLSVYTQYHSRPDLTLERVVYRVLLFEMNVLGERDFNRWMAHPVCF